MVQKRTEDALCTTFDVVILGKQFKRGNNGYFEWYLATNYKSTGSMSLNLSGEPMTK
jgi:hypothetical protein